MPRQPVKPLSFSEICELVDAIHNHGINVRNREIFLVNNDAEDASIDFTTATRFLKNLSVLEQLGRSKVIIHLHTEGGDWFDGMAIYNAIKASKCQTTMVVYAQAQSMGGVILQAADKRLMMPESYLMIHHGSVGFDPMVSQAASEYVKLNDAGCKKMLQIFAHRAVHGPFFSSKRWGVNKIAEFFDKEIRTRGDWYLNAEQAVDYGLADQIVDYCVR